MFVACPRKRKGGTRPALEYLLERGVGIYFFFFVAFFAVVFFFLAGIVESPPSRPKPGFPTQASLDS